jgi:cysteine desulfurase
MNEPIYLDYNATTPVAPEVLDAMLPFSRERFGNPSSSHANGRIARQAIEQARDRVAGAKRHLVTSAVEHPAVMVAARQLEEQGGCLTVVPVDRFGHIAPDDIARAAGAVRLSVGRGTTLDEIDRAAEALIAAHRRAGAPG